MACITTQHTNTTYTHNKHTKHTNTHNILTISTKVDPTGLVTLGSNVAVVRQAQSTIGKSYDHLLKVIIIGDSGAGKSSLIKRFSDDTFTESYISTIGVDFACRTLEFASNLVVKLQIWDTSGQERFRSITSSYYRGAHGIIMVYNCDSSNAFQNLPNWLREARNNACTDCPVMVIAAKNDLTAVVSDAEGEEWARANGCLFASTSSKLDRGVFEAFSRLAKVAGNIAGAEAVPGQERAVASKNDGVDSNVLRLNLDKLAVTNVPLVTGDPIRCRCCGVMLSMLSVIKPVQLGGGGGAKKSSSSSSSTAAARSRVEIAPPIHPAFAASVQPLAGPASCSWTCEFCAHENLLAASEPELRELMKASTVEYLVRPAPQTSIENDNNNSDDVNCGKKTIIFAVDVSGSMCSSEEVPTATAQKLRGAGGVSQEFQNLLQQGDGALYNQRLPRQKHGVAYVSRLSLVQGAIAKSIEDLWAKDPSVYVGIVAFSDVVTWIGDGQQPEEVLAGDKLNSLEQLSASRFRVRTPLAKSKKGLLQKLWSLKEGGRTALGPALLTALGASSAGGNVILATDGLASIGVGDCSDPDSTVDATQFYIEMGEKCRVEGLSVSILSFQGEDCRLSMLERVVAMSHGTLERINPLKLEQVMATVVEKPVIASTVMSMVCLHRGLHFKGEADDELEGRRWLVKDAGTVHAGDLTTYSFGFCSKSEVDLSGTTNVPIQVQILFTTPEGAQYVRCSTQQLQLTSDESAAAVSMDASVIVSANAQKAAKLLKGGQKKEAQDVLASTQRLLASRGEARQELNIALAENSDELCIQTAQLERLM